MSQSGGDGMKGSGGDGGGERKGKGIAAADPSDKSPLSSSIGEQSTSDDEDDTEEVQAPSSALDCLTALENTLPMKRGLSSYYSGKTKSFGNLTDLPLDDPNELVKKEHPVNKRRRLLLAHETFHDKKTGGSSSANVAPALPSDDQTNEEAADDDDVEENTGDDDDQNGDGDDN